MFPPRLSRWQTVFAAACLLAASTLLTVSPADAAPKEKRKSKVEQPDKSSSNIFVEPTDADPEGLLDVRSQEQCVELKKSAGASYHKVRAAVARMTQQNQAGTLKQL